MARLRAVAICGAIIALPSLASAQQTGLTERIRVQGIYANQMGQAAPDDFAAQVVPELSLLVLGKRSQLRATYTLAATAHSTLPADLANGVSLVSTSDLSKRTALLLSAQAGHTTVTNALIASPSSSAPVGAVPLAAGQLVTARVGEGFSWDASPIVRFSQIADAAYLTTINTPQSFDGYQANAVLSLDRTWKADAAGVDLRGGYSRSHVTPLPPDRLVPLALTPHWRHDFSRSLTSLFAAGPQVVLSPDAGTRPLVGPFAQASFLYVVDDTSYELLGSMGTQTTALTAQMIRAEVVTLRVSTPLSVEHAVVTAAAVGYTHGSIVDLHRNAVLPPDFDTAIADASIAWSPTDAVQLFARYQFLDQITASTQVANIPAIQRNTVIVGIQLFSRLDPVHVPTKFPQRVDRGDAAPQR